MQDKRGSKNGEVKYEWKKSGALGAGGAVQGRENRRPRLGMCDHRRLPADQKPMMHE
jgi:hypothetical protein